MPQTLADWTTGWWGVGVSVLGGIVGTYLVRWIDASRAKYSKAAELRLQARNAEFRQLVESMVGNAPMLIHVAARVARDRWRALFDLILAIAGYALIAFASPGVGSLKIITGLMATYSLVTFVSRFGRIARNSAAMDHAERLYLQSITKPAVSLLSSDRKHEPSSPG